MVRGDLRVIERCWLHIGTGKTGSTSTQNYLAYNRDALLANGYLFPRAPGAGNHHALMAYALDDAIIDSTRKKLGLVGADRLAAFRRNFPAALRAETARSGATDLILSNEMLALHLRTPSAIERLRDLCDGLAAHTKVIVYIRNQVDFLAGIYMTSVGGGNARDLDPQWVRGADYAEMLARWSAVFGRQNMIVRRYERRDFPGGDVRRDFSAQLGIDADRLVTTSRQRNRSLDAESVAFVRAYNRSVPAALAGPLAPLRFAMVAVLERRRGGTRFGISSGLAAKIEDTFRASNAKVAAEYFPSLAEPLFSPPRCVDDTGADKTVRWPTMLGIAFTLPPFGVYLFAARLVRLAVERWRYRPHSRRPIAATKGTGSDLSSGERAA